MRATLGHFRGTSKPSGARRERLDRAGALEPPRLRPLDATAERPNRTKPTGRC